MDIIKERFKYLCRVCMEKCEKKCLTKIFNSEVGSVPISQMLSFTAPINIVPDDDLPSSICGTCLNKLISAYNFQQMCIDTDLKLRCELKDEKPNQNISVSPTILEQIRTGATDGIPIDSDDDIEFFNEKSEDIITICDDDDDDDDDDNEDDDDIIEISNGEKVNEIIIDGNDMDLEESIHQFTLTSNTTNTVNSIIENNVAIHQMNDTNKQKHNRMRNDNNISTITNDWKEYETSKLNKQPKINLYNFIKKPQTISTPIISNNNEKNLPIISNSMSLAPKILQKSSSSSLFQLPSSTQKQTFEVKNILMGRPCKILKRSTVPISNTTVITNFPSKQAYSGAVSNENIIVDEKIHKQFQQHQQQQEHQTNQSNQQQIKINNQKHTIIENNSQKNFFCNDCEIFFTNTERFMLHKRSNCFGTKLLSTSSKEFSTDDKIPSRKVNYNDLKNKKLNYVYNCIPCGEKLMHEKLFHEHLMKMHRTKYFKIFLKSRIAETVVIQYTPSYPNTTREKLSTLPILAPTWTSSSSSKTASLSGSSLSTSMLSSTPKTASLSSLSTSLPAPAATSSSTSRSISATKLTFKPAVATSSTSRLIPTSTLVSVPTAATSSTSRLIPTSILASVPAAATSSTSRLIPTSILASVPAAATSSTSRLIPTSTLASVSAAATSSPSRLISTSTLASVSAAATLSTSRLFPTSTLASVPAAATSSSTSRSISATASTSSSTSAVAVTSTYIKSANNESNIINAFDQSGKRRKIAIMQNGKLVCSICKKIYNNWKDVHTHLKEHKIQVSKEPKMKVTSSNSQIMNQILSKMKCYKCNICEKICNSWTEFQKHVTGHKRIIPALTEDIQCHFCKKIFATSSSLKLHLNEHKIKVSYSSDTTGSIPTVDVSVNVQTENETDQNKIDVVRNLTAHEHTYTSQTRKSSLINLNENNDIIKLNNQPQQQLKQIIPTATNPQHKNQKNTFQMNFETTTTTIDNESDQTKSNQLNINNEIIVIKDEKNDDEEGCTDADLSLIKKKYYSINHDNCNCVICEKIVQPKNFLDEYKEFTMNNVLENFFKCDQCNKFFDKQYKFNQHKIVHHNVSGYESISISLLDQIRSDASAQSGAVASQTSSLSETAASPSLSGTAPLHTSSLSGTAVSHTPSSDNIPSPSTSIEKSENYNENLFPTEEVQISFDNSNEPVREEDDPFATVDDSINIKSLDELYDEYYKSVKQNSENEINKEKCKICELSLATKPGLKRHMERWHGNGKQLYLMMCKICGKGLHDETKLRNHIQNIHIPTLDNLDNKNINTIVSAFPSSSLNFVTKTEQSPNESLIRCKYCANDKFYKLYSTLLRHIRSRHRQRYAIFINYLIKKQQTEINQSNLEAYYCNICDKKFDEKNTLIQHLFNHRKIKNIRRQSAPVDENDTKKLCCELCHKLIDKINFDHHLKFVHSKNEIDDNNERNSIMKRKSNIDNNERNSIMKRKSNIFENTINNGNSLKPILNRRQSLSATLMLNCKCSICSKEFSSTDLLKRHLRVVHISNGDIKKENLILDNVEAHGIRFKCHQCEKYTTCTYKYLTKHIKSNHHNDKNKNEQQWYKCSTCHKVFLVKSNYESHIKIHEMQQNQIDNETLNESDDDTDSNDENETEKEEEEDKKNDKDYEIDNDSVEDENDDNNDNDKDDDNDDNENVPKSLQPHKCLYCRYICKNQRHLRLHLKAEHPECIEEKLKNGSNSNQCDICTKTLSSKSNLDRHISLHFHNTNDIEYENALMCKICKTSFSKLKNFKNHLVKVHKEKRANAFKLIHINYELKQYKCEFCSIKFDSNFEYKNHTTKFCTMMNKRTNKTNENETKTKINNSLNNISKTSSKSSSTKTATATTTTAAVKRSQQQQDEYQDLKKIKLNEEEHTSVILLICKICGKKFYRNSHLIAHQPLHKNGYKRVKQEIRCKICNKYLKEDSLSYHFGVYHAFKEEIVKSGEYRKNLQINDVIKLNRDNDESAKINIKRRKSIHHTGETTTSLQNLNLNRRITRRNTIAFVDTSVMMDRRNSNDMETDIDTNNGENSRSIRIKNMSSNSNGRGDSSIHINNEENVMENTDSENKKAELNYNDDLFVNEKDSNGGMVESEEFETIILYGNFNE